MSGLAKSVFLIMILLVMLNSLTETKKDLYKFSINRMVCEDADPRIIYNYSCSTEKISRDLRIFSGVIIPYPNMSFNHIYVKIDYFQRTGPTYKRSLASIEENFCAYLAGKTKSYLIRILWPAIKRASNLQDRCPFSGVFNISRMVFEDTFLPPALPEGQSRLDIHVRVGRERLSLLKVKYYIEIKPKGAAKLDF